VTSHINKTKGFESNKQFYRKFGNHEYWNAGETSTKSKAISRAAELRKEGYLVRITKSTISSSKGWYALWVSPRE
jgi:predicted phosphohydrolase